ncbi:hypothetical protein KCP73_06030 [Salmonella enterica subsp. enterica]|nr:hypothetical protein KCP73_06030 [Salmonella enterica subsp. enterica]
MAISTAATNWITALLTACLRLPVTIKFASTTGAGSVARDYKATADLCQPGVNTDATFSAANKADWVPTYRAKREAYCRAGTDGTDRLPPGAELRFCEPVYLEHGTRHRWYSS